MNTVSNEYSAYDHGISSYVTKEIYRYVKYLMKNKKYIQKKIVNYCTDKNYNEHKFLSHFVNTYDG